MGLGNLVGFGGRIARGRFLFHVVVAFVLAHGGFELMAGFDGPQGVAMLAASLAMAVVVLSSGLVRRLHDMDRSGWLALVGIVPMLAIPATIHIDMTVAGLDLAAFLPLLGVALVLLLLVQPGSKDPNRYGARPE
jgi:uncharacterized membrane protein YhaH (DUF805 family)